MHVCVMVYKIKAGLECRETLFASLMPSRYPGQLRMGGVMPSNEPKDMDAK